MQDQDPEVQVEVFTESAPLTFKKEGGKFTVLEFWIISEVKVQERSTRS